MKKSYLTSLDDVKPLYEAPSGSDPDLKKIQQMMEEMANAPKEEYGTRQPGESCAFEWPARIIRETEV